ncbi:MAG: hypothetical protein GXY55_01230 [Phycisphaerae bacterium]|nr:hypothetical protein [Phycisphaerae bacterium]
MYTYPLGIRRPTRTIRMLWGALACTLLLISGCFPALPEDYSDRTVGVDPTMYPDLRVQGEPNDTFDTALTIILNTKGRAYLQGTISTPDDVDVFVMDGLTPGDRLLVDVGSVSAALDARLAIFDEAGRLAFENDDRSAALFQYDPYLNVVIRRESMVYFLAIARSPFAERRAYGSYEALITVVHGSNVPVPVPQTLVLNFGGGSIFIPPSSRYTVGAFDTADIHPAYAGQTQAVQNQIVATMLNNFEGLALDLRVVPSDAWPPANTYSTLLFGGTHSRALGIAQDIDAYNSDQTDEAIVFTDLFTPSRFGRVLSNAELGTAIGNVATHEMGHLLGLRHVANIYDLMDTTGSSATLLLNQDWLDSPLDETIFPIGTQDGLLLLLETIGWLP